MKEYRLLTKDSKENRRWWAPEDLEDGWFPWELTYLKLEEVLEEKAAWERDFPEEEYKIQERKVTKWTDSD